MPKPTSRELSPRQLREATRLRERIDALRQKLQAILGKENGRTIRKPTRKLSAEGRARMAAAARARWARTRANPTPARAAKAPLR